MTTHRTFLSAIALLFSWLAVPAQAIEAWETAAVNGIKAMNLGDGEAFAEVAHIDFKTRMRKFMVDRMRATPTSADTQSTLKDYGVGSLAELEKLSLDQFIKTTISRAHESIPQPMRVALEDAQFRVLKSEAVGDGYRVSVEMTFTLNGKAGGRPILLLARRDGDTWKYYGDTK
jgi:hypothetical protein